MKRRKKMRPMLLKAAGYFLLPLMATVVANVGSGASGQNAPQNSKDVISFNQISEFGRPANFYRLDKGNSDLCAPLIKALNEPFKADHHLPTWVSALLLKSSISVKWKEVKRIGLLSLDAVNIDLFGEGRPRWILREMDGTKTGNGNSTLFAPKDVTARLQEMQAMSWGKLGRIARGEKMETFKEDGRRYYKNAILPFLTTPLVHRAESSSYDYFQYHWDLVEIDNQPVVLSVELRDDPGPQRIHARAFVMKDNREGTLTCDIVSKAEVTDINF